MELNNELDPDEAGTKRPGIQYHKNEIGKEQTGVTHLVHAWTMQGHKVSCISLWNLVLLKPVSSTFSNTRMALFLSPRTGFKVAQPL